MIAITEAQYLFFATLSRQKQGDRGIVEYKNIYFISITIN